MRQLKITKSITNRESASLDRYLQEIGHEELISVSEEVELAQRIKKGDHAALEKLTKANLRFVVSVAKQYLTSLTRVTWALSVPPRNSMKRAVSNSSLMPSGGFVSPYCRPWLNRAASYVCRSTRSVL